MEDSKVMEVLSKYWINMKLDGGLIISVPDLANVLGINNASGMIKKLKPSYKVKRGMITNGGNQEVNYITKDGLFHILSSSRSTKAKEIAQELGLKVITTVVEQDTTQTIINSIKGIIRYELQYSVGGYRIDMYLPRLKLAIECDENDHKMNREEDEIERQSYIEEAEQCRFIRYDPYSKTFNIGNVINEIFSEYVRV